NSVFFSSWGPAVFGPPLATGRWYHVAATNIGTYGRLYLDGELVAEGDLSINTIVAEPYTSIFMGTIPTVIGDIRKLQGSVDEVTVYDRALSHSEIRSIFNAGSAG